jgi:hypothetical protein
MRIEGYEFGIELPDDDETRPNGYAAIHRPAANPEVAGNGRPLPQGVTGLGIDGFDPITRRADVEDAVVDDRGTLKGADRARLNDVRRNEPLDIIRRDLIERRETFVPVVTPVASPISGAVRQSSGRIARTAADGHAQHGQSDRDRRAPPRPAGRYHGPPCKVPHALSYIAARRYVAPGIFHGS